MTFDISDYTVAGGVYLVALSVQMFRFREEISYGCGDGIE